MTTPATLLATLARRPASADPDADLLGRFVAHGDAAAFEELVHRYGRLVWRVARTQCRSDATAEDVFQATFAVLSRKAGTVRTPAALAGWLHLTAHRLAVRATRRERPTVPLPPDLAESADPLDALTARELLAAVDDELTKLTDAERAVLLLCGIDGVSNGDAATRLGISSGSVKGRLERARQKLRDRLTARGLTLPAVLVGLIGFAPPASAVEAAVAIPIGGALSPAVASLITETIPMKAKAALAVAVAGLLLLTGGVMTDNGVSPTATAAPVPRDFKPLPKEAWGEAKDGLQAGLRMPDGATLEVGQSKEIQVVVRNVGLLEREVWYTPQQPGIGLCGDTQDGRFRLSHFAIINGILPGPVNVVLKPGGELVRWHSKVRHAPPNDDLLGGVIEPRLDLTTGTHTLRMHHVGGDLVDEMTPRDGPLAIHYYATLPLALATGELEVRCVPARPAPRRNAPVPKDAAKAVLWSEPVRVDWKGSGAERINGVWMPDGKSVIVPTPTLNEKGEQLEGGGVDLRDATTGKVRETISIRDGRPKDRVEGDLAISADGTLLCYVTDAEHRRMKALSAVFDPMRPKYATCLSTDYRPLAVSCSAQGNCVACLSGQSNVDICKVAKPEFNVFHIRVLKGEVLKAVACHPTGSYVVAAGESGRVLPIRFETGEDMDKPGSFDAKFHAVAVSPDGKVIAAGGEPGKGGQSLAVIDGCTDKALGKEFRTVKDAVPPKERINGLAFYADGKHLAAACSDGFIRVFDVAAGKLVASAKEHKEEVFSVAYSPDGKKLLTVGRDAMKVWDVARLMAK